MSWEWTHSRQGRACRRSRWRRRDCRAWCRGASSITKVSHYATDSDEPAWVLEDSTLPSDVTRYVSGVEGDLAITTTLTGGRVIHLVDLHGDVVGTLPLANSTTTPTWAGLKYFRADEFGVPINLGSGAPSPGRYGWLGAFQRSGEALGGVVLMGVRLYQPATGRFMSPDPVPGGSASAYDYCSADPVNCTDLGGTFSFGSILNVVAAVGEIASVIPGPIGAAAAGVSAVAYAAPGNTAQALIMGATAAAALVGAGAVVRVAARAVSTAVSTGRVAAGATRAARSLSTVAVRARDAIEHVQITARLSFHARRAARTVQLTERQALAARARPHMAAVFRGERIDNAVRQAVSNSRYLSSRLTVCARGARCADFTSRATGRWYDVTTRAALPAHVRRYGSSGATGIIYR